MVYSYIFKPIDFNSLSEEQQQQTELQSSYTRIIQRLRLHINSNINTHSQQSRRHFWPQIS